MERNSFFCHQDSFYARTSTQAALAEDSLLVTTFHSFQSLKKNPENHLWVGQNMNHFLLSYSTFYKAKSYKRGVSYFSEVHDITLAQV